MYNCKTQNSRAVFTDFHAKIVLRRLKPLFEQVHWLNVIHDITLC